MARRGPLRSSSMETTGLILLLVAVAAVVLGRMSLADRRAARIERKLDRIVDHLGLRERDPRMAEVLTLLRAERKIQAIKLYREITGAGLKEAKDAVEAME